jgi:multicomponent Na+:H+ antiporter subunit B
MDILNIQYFLPASWLLLPYNVEFDLTLALLVILSIGILGICLKLILADTLLESVINMSVFSLCLSVYYLLLDAPDVAMTESAIGVCLSTCLLLNLVSIFEAEAANKLLQQNRMSQPHTIALKQKITRSLAVMLCLIMVLAITWAGLDLPDFGSIYQPLHTHINEYYLTHTQIDIGINSPVAAILASYRGYDTLGETSVILIAGLGVVIILAGKKNHVVT